MLLRTSLVFSALLWLTGTAFALDAGSDADIKKQIIADSIASYPGPCACPYQSARNGSSCGKRSAYIRPGGYAPICYDTDVTPEMVQRFKLKQKVKN
jgi:hypothetical protein